MSECKCTLREIAVGDGCRYCNPQFLIDHLADQRDEQAEEIEQLQARVKELETALKKQAKAVLSGMDAARAEGALRMEIAERLNAESRPELIESEREANAILTAEVERLEAENAELRAELFCNQMCVRYWPSHHVECCLLSARLKRIQQQADDEGEA